MASDMKRLYSIPANIKLRPVVDDDHEFLVELHNDPEVLVNMTHPEPITMEHHLAWWSNIKNDPKQQRLIFEVDGHRTGFTKFYDIDAHNGCCVLGADIHKAYRGSGYAKFMWMLMIQRCFNVLSLHRISLTTADYNVIGQRVYRSLGFREEGKLIQSLYREGQYHDQLLMYMLSDWKEDER